MSLTSSETFVKALRAPNDPPYAGFPYKVEMAASAWEQADFYLPSKAQVIAEWLLATLLKAADRPQDGNPLLDAKYWDLLVDVTQETKAYGSANSYPVPSWLPSLLHRIPVVPMVTAILRIQAIHLPSGATVTQSLLRFLDIAWPIATQKCSLDGLFDCFCASIHACLRYSTCFKAPGTWLLPNKLVILVSDSFRTACSAASSVKKPYSSFLDDQLQFWLPAAWPTEESLPENQLVSLSLRYAGIELLFHSDILKRSHSGLLLLDRLQILAPNLLVSFGNALHDLLNFYAKTLKLNFSVVHSQAHVANKSDMEQVVAESGMEFFRRSLNLLEDQYDAFSWQIRCRLLRTIENERLYIHQHQQVLELFITPACYALKQHSQNCSEGVKSNVLEGLIVVSRLDYDLIKCRLEDILTELLLLPVSQYEAPLTFLQLLLSHHEKTRTLPDCVALILEVLSAKDRPIEDWAEYYRVATSGPLFSLAFQEDWKRSLSTFLTPGQCLQVAFALCEAVQKKYIEWNDCTFIAATDSQPAYPMALTFFLVTTFSSYSFVWLPFHLMSAWDIQETRGKVQRLFHLISKLEIARVLPQWTNQIVTAAILRLRHVLLTPKIKKYFGPLNDLLCLPTCGIDKLLLGDGIIGELALEVGLVALDPTSFHEEGLDNVLSYLEANLPLVKRWDGMACGLTRSVEECTDAALGLWRELLERYLPAIAPDISDRQWPRIISLLIDYWDPDTNRGDSYSTVGYVVRRAISSAQFWEVDKLKASTLSGIMDRLKPLQDIPLLELLSELKSGFAKEKLGYPRDEYISLFDLLFSIPLESLSRDTREALLQLSMRADICESAFVSLGKITDMECDRRCTLLRKYAYEVMRTEGLSLSSEIDVPLIDYLLNPDYIPKKISFEFDCSTIHLTKTFFLNMVGFVPHEKGRNLTHHFLEQMCSWVTLWTVREHNPWTTLQVEALTVLMDIIYDKPTLRLSPVMRRFEELIIISVAPRLLSLITTFVEKPVPPELAQLHAALLILWCSVIRRVGVHGLTFQVPTLIPFFLSKAIEMNTKLDANIRPLWWKAIITVIFMEKDHLNVEGATHLRYLVLTYIAFARHENHPDNNFEALALGVLGPELRKLASEEYTHLIALVEEGTRDPILTHCDRLSFWELSYIMCRECPENTTFLIYRHVSATLKTIANDSTLFDSPQLKLRILRWLNLVCANKSAGLKVSDVANIWATLSQYLSGSTIHEDTTIKNMFYSIVHVAISIVLSRRDLVNATIPQLVEFARRSILVLGRARPHLGSKQTSLVSHKLPRWIQPSEPLGKLEGKVLSRFFTTLQTKTILRFPGGYEKAESLSRSLAMHAPYILQSYISLLNDSLVMLPSDGRRELEAGVFVLCDMSSIHVRDAIMAGLADAGEKASWKSLWQDYERQKYVGKG